MNQVNYKALYLDFLKETKVLKKCTQKDLIKLISCEPEPSVNQLIHINWKIKNEVSSAKNRKRLQQLKAYDQTYINDVLEYQKKNKLSNTAIANEFELSRNTIADWKKKFDKVN